jgi:diadenosine tetraphosphate (Ap4A) HIT family hydrolase
MLLRPERNHPMEQATDAAQVEVVVDHDDYRSICSFCAEISGRPEHNLLIELMPESPTEDFILYETPRFTVVPGAGAVNDGYVFIIPKEHVLSFGYLDEAHDEELARLLDTLSGHLEKTFGRPIIAFEHGAESFRNRGGSCTDHAHMHVMPIDPQIDLVGPLSEEFEVRQATELLPAIRDQVQERRQPYLWLRTTDGLMWICDAPHALAQHIRRIIVDRLGRPGEWDWAVFSGVEHMRATVRSFRESPMK